MSAAALPLPTADLRSLARELFGTTFRFDEVSGHFVARDVLAVSRALSGSYIPEADWGKPAVGPHTHLFGVPVGIECGWCHTARGWTYDCTNCGGPPT